MFQICELPKAKGVITKNTISFKALICFENKKERSITGAIKKVTIPDAA